MRTYLPKTLLCAAALSVAFATAASAAPEVKSQKQVQQALGTLNRVVDHTGRLISQKKYGLLPSENNEFKEGVAALQQTLSGQPADLKSSVGPMLKKASDQSQDMANAANSRDRSKVLSSHAALANSVKQIIAAFPADAQPGRPNVAREREEEKVRAQAK